jgi:hypothetical protein
LRPASDGSDDFVGVCDPMEGLRLGIVILEEAVDGGLEVGDGSEDAAFETALRQDGEQTLDGVEPGGRGRGEVERPARMARQPLAHGEMLVRSVVVEDRMDRLAGGDFSVEEPDELLMAMAVHIAAHHGSVEHVHRGKQGRCPVPLVIMGHGSSTAFLERQAGLRSVERLDLALFVDAEHDGVRRRIDIEPTMSRSLSTNSGCLDSLNCRTRCGWSPCARQMRRTDEALMPAALAIAAPVQCVVSP